MLEHVSGGAIQIRSQMIAHADRRCESSIRPPYRLTGQAKAISLAAAST
jgi:hypothetical protein